MKDRIYSFKETCEYIGVSKNTAVKIRKHPDFPKAIKISESRLGFRKSEIDVWLESRKELA